MFNDVRELVISESVRKMESDLRGQVLWESLTIPMKEGDPVEEALYGLLDKQYKYSDAIVRWFRNDRKDGIDDATLKRTYVDGIQTIYDLLKDYDRYVEELKKQKRLGKVSLSMGNGKIREVDPVKDFPTMRHLSGVRDLVRALGDAVHSRVKIDSSVAKYQITEDDMKNIGILGDSGKVVCWYTRTFESTNKFVFQLWQNAETMDRGDAYGDKTEQSPYCTHAKNHWDSYAGNDPDYMQYWFLEKIPGVMYPFGNLSDSGVAKAFNAMKGRGPDVIVAMNDTNNDFLDDDDENFDNFDELRDDLGSTVEFLSDRLFVSNKNYVWNLRWDDDEGWIEKRQETDDGKIVPKAFAGQAGDDVEERQVEQLSIISPVLTEIPPLPKGYVVSDETRFTTVFCKSLKSLDGLPDRADGSLYGLGMTGFSDSGLAIAGCKSLDADDVIDDKRIDVFKQVRQFAGRNDFDVDISPDGMTATVRLNPSEMKLSLMPKTIASLVNACSKHLKGTDVIHAEAAIVAVLQSRNEVPMFNMKWEMAAKDNKKEMFGYAKSVYDEVVRKAKALGVDDVEDDPRTSGSYKFFDQQLVHICSNAERRYYAQKVGDLLHLVCPAITIQWGDGVFITVNARDIVRLNIKHGNLDPLHLLSFILNTNIDDEAISSNADSPVFDFSENRFGLSEEDKAGISRLADEFIDEIRQKAS